MGKWFLDFSFWIQGYRTAQTAHFALKPALSPLKGPSIFNFDHFLYLDE